PPEGLPQPEVGGEGANDSRGMGGDARPVLPRGYRGVGAGPAGPAPRGASGGLRDENQSVGGFGQGGPPGHGLDPHDHFHPEPESSPTRGGTHQAGPGHLLRPSDYAVKRGRSGEAEEAACLSRLLFAWGGFPRFTTTSKRRKRRCASSCSGPRTPGSPWTAG